VQDFTRITNEKEKVAKVENKKSPEVLPPGIR